MKRLSGCVLGLVVLGTAASAADWPQFLGPMRNGHSPETGLLHSLPKKGPPVVWSRNVGAGYSGPVVVGKRLILFHRVGDEDRVECLEAATGKPLWKFSYATEYRDRLGKGDGPRSTPLVAGKHVYTLAADGRLHCLELESGKKVWVRPQRRLSRAAGLLRRGHLAIAGGRQRGGQRGGRRAGIVALNKNSGREVWKATGDAASYSSPVAATFDGKQRLVFFTRTGLVILDPTDGTVLQSKRWRARIDASVNAAVPVVVGDEVFLSTCYDVGATVLRVTKDSLKTLWANDESLSAHFSTPVYLKGELYGFHGRQEEGTQFRCVDWKTGKVRWSKEGFGCGSIIAADGQLLVLSESGELVLVQPTPDAYREKGRAAVLTGPVRAHPALAGGLLYGRDNRKLVCWNLRAAK